MKKINRIIILLAIIPFCVSIYCQNCKDAEQYFNKAIKLSNGIADLISKEILYKKAIDMCSDYAEAHNNLGDVYEKQGRYEEAINQYKKASSIRPDSPYPYFGIGDVYFKTGRFKEAKIWYKQAMDTKEKVKLDEESKNLLMEYENTTEKLKMAEKLEKSGLIKAVEIEKMATKMRGMGEEVSITFGEGLISFDFNKYDLKEVSKYQLNEIGKYLEGLFNVENDFSLGSRRLNTYEIEGHTDIRGTDEYNIKLSEKRARTVKEYLIKNFKIPEEKLEVKGYGERAPICTEGASEDKESPCNALNRRVVIKERGMVAEIRGGGGKDGLIIKMDTAFFYIDGEKKDTKYLKEGEMLKSKKDKYFIYFKPFQRCYVYIIQVDSGMNYDLLFPRKDQKAEVEEGKDYWVPEFGRAFTLDETVGEEKLYLIASIEDLKLEQIAGNYREEMGAAINGIKSRGIKTRSVKVAEGEGLSEIITYYDAEWFPYKVEKLEKNKEPQYIEQIEGEGAWVKIIKFIHR